MRSFVFLLVLANLLFFAWAQGYFPAAATSDASRVAQQLSPEKLRIVSRGEAPAVPESAPVAAPVAVSSTPSDLGVCLTWPLLAAADAETLLVAIAQKSPAARVEKQAGVAQTSWWTFIPPQKTKADAERKAGELKAIGVKDFFVVQEAGASRWAISLGVFSNEEAANAALESLREKGVRSAKVGPKGAPVPVVTLSVRTNAGDAAVLRALSSQAAVECALPAAVGAATAPGA